MLLLGLYLPKALEFFDTIPCCASTRTCSGTVIGELSVDSVIVGALSLENTTFGRVIVEPGPLSEWGAPVMDGILGLAFPIIAMPLLSMLDGPFDEMMKRKLLPADIFSVYLSSVMNDSSSFVEFGAVDATYYTPPLITVPQDALQPVLGYWCTSVTGIKVGNTLQPGTTNVIGVIDTGTSLIAGPPDVVNPIIAQVRSGTHRVEWSVHSMEDPVVQSHWSPPLRNCVLNLSVKPLVKPAHTPPVGRHDR